MRIIAGKLRSRKFAAPSGDNTRPTSDRAKVALFNILRERLGNARVLDGFAGSGALSFEALSRGSAEAVLFETDNAAVKQLRRSAEQLGLLSQVEIRQGDFLEHAAGLAGRVFDIVFLDPPYGSGLLQRAIAAAGSLLARGGVVVAEHSASEEMPNVVGPLMNAGTRRYGSVAFSLYKGQDNQ